MGTFQRMGTIWFCSAFLYGTACGAQQENYAETEKALWSALKEAESAGRADLPLAEALYNLGAFYKVASKPAEAEKFYLRSLAVREKVHGAEHRSLVRPLISLATLYLEHGMYGKAERLHRRSTAVLRSLPPDDQDAAWMLHNLAALYYVQGQYAVAEPLYRQTLEGFEKSFGPEDKEVALVLNNLAMLCAKTGRHEAAISYFERALKIWERTFGSNHPHVARALTNLAGLYSVQGRRKEAEALFQRALRIAESMLGPENPLVVTILSEYAVLLRKTKRKAEAKPLEKRAQAIREALTYQSLGRHTVDVGDLRMLPVNRSGKH